LREEQPPIRHRRDAARAASRCRDVVFAEYGAVRRHAADLVGEVCCVPEVAVGADRDAAQRARFDVQIDVKSVDSMDKDRDTTIRGPDIFDVAHWPTAHYVTRSITKTAAGYSAVGALTLRGVTKDVPIAFQFTQGAPGAKLEGGAKLKRLDFGVGQGDWKSTEWVADTVQISFSLVLKPKT